MRQLPPYPSSKRRKAGGIGVSNSIFFPRDRVMETETEGTQGHTVWLYNVNGSIIAIRRGKDVHGGTPLHFDVPASGTYLVKIGNHPARRVVVIK